jgi:ABC-2 type transport system ATP-binding protein
MTTTSTHQILIEASGLVRSFGARRAVAGLSLEVRQGELVGLLGPNGAGKSTALRLLAGYLDPDEGSVAIAGHPMQTERRAAQAELGYVPEGAPGYEALTPRELFAFVGRARGLTKAQLGARIETVRDFAHLDNVMEQRFENLSKGFRRRVAIAAGLLADPPVLILDEPTDGLDPNQKRALRRDLRELARTKAILISTHILEEVPALCDRVVLIADGEAVFRGTPAELEALGNGDLDRAFATVTKCEVPT